MCKGIAMDRIKIRIAVVLVALVLINVFVRIVYLRFDHTSEADSSAISRIPQTIGKWQGRDYPLEEKIYQILETRFIIHRNYTSEGKNIFVSIVYYPETKVDFHAPEGCLAGEGVVITKTQAQVLINKNGQEIPLKINRLTRETRSGGEVIYYFYKAGDFVGDNYIRLRFNLIKNIFLSRKKSGALIRISTPVGKGHVEFEDDPKILSQFINELYPYIEKYL